MTEKAFSFLRNNRGIGKTGSVIGICLILIAAAGVGALIGTHMPIGGFSGGVREVLAPPFGGKRVVRILALGEDNTGLKANARGLSDTIMLLSVDLDSKRVAALSIPRDTKVDLMSYGGVCKINSSHKIGGPSLTANAVSDLTGIRSDYYMKINLDGFKKTVDILGGVEIDVEKNMHYVDNWGGLYINLKKGRQLLDGENAMGYVRFRHDALGDITRMERQQKFLKALAKKTMTPAKLPVLPAVMQSVMKNIETDLTVKDAVFLAKFFSSINIDEVKTATLPGTPENIGGASYMVANPDETAKVVQELFFPPLPGLPKSEVLNGSGVSGAAQKVAEELRSRGYEVASVGNAGSYDFSSSQIISHKRDLQGVDQIASIMTPAVTKQDEDPAAKVDITIIVGKDCMYIGAGS